MKGPIVPLEKASGFPYLHFNQR